MIGYLAGISGFLIFSFIYFFQTNKDLFKISGKTAEFFQKDSDKENPLNTALSHEDRWLAMNKSKSWIVLTYISSPLKVQLARNSNHYDKDLLRKVFEQNHINASIFEIALIISFVLIGSFRDINLFFIPAAASFLLAMTIFLMLISALLSWFKKWTYTLIVIGFIILNILSSRYNAFKFKNQAYGLNYDIENADYSEKRIDYLAYSKDLNKEDYNHGIEILNNWKKKHTLKGIEKPVMVFISTSGGGLRSALWTFNCLSKIDHRVGGKLANNTQVITGSSGGLIGAAYFRELCLRSDEDPSISRYDPIFLEKISMDVLNPILFTMATNDIFIRYQRFTEGDYTYTIDRGYAFEKALNENTDNWLNKTLKDYAADEYNSNIPMLIISPTIINDGRRLLISSQPISYLCNDESNFFKKSEYKLENIEFQKIFEKQNAPNLRFTSALRMNATFPYILPTVSLPSKPRMEVMDAGLRDNYGVQSNLQFMFAFKEWIKENTSGVLLVQIRDDIFDNEDGKSVSSLSHRITSPIGALYGNLTHIQEYTNANSLKQAEAWLDHPFEMVQFSLKHKKRKQISLSWHLTSLEKKQICDTFFADHNQESMDRIKEILISQKID